MHASAARYIRIVEGLGIESDMLCKITAEGLYAPAVLFVFHAHLPRYGGGCVFILLISGGR